MKERKRSPPMKKLLSLLLIVCLLLPVAALAESAPVTKVGQHL